MIYFVQSMRAGNFSGGPVVKTLPSNARGALVHSNARFDLWSESQDPICLLADKLKHKTEAIL